MTTRKKEPKEEKDNLAEDAETATFKPKDDETSAENASEPQTQGSTMENTESGERSTGDQFVDGAKKAASTAGKALGTAGKKATDAVKSVHKDPLFTVRFLDKLLDWARSTFPANMFEGITDWFTRYGHTGIVLSAAVSLIFWIIASFRLGENMGFWSAILRGVGYAILIVILQYTATKFLTAGQDLVKSSPSRLGSAAFLDCLALLTGIVGIIGFIVAIAHREWAAFFVGLGVWGLCDSISLVALHPSIANIIISKNTAAGEEAIGILSFLIKAVVRVVPIVFGVGSFVGLLVLTVSTIGVFPVSAGRNALNMIVACACLPFATYILFVLYHLIIDVLRAILVLPGKIDDAGK
ncbi:MAG: hypothetical protein JXN60_05540 [Lentisphaerae bacterium]|nr:hypothetical protein [Lentisphaerota bacterium]